MTAHVHRLERTPAGIVCTAGCALSVEKPRGMPDYSRAGMGAWR